jgi:hypothetical protein
MTSSSAEVPALSPEEIAPDSEQSTASSIT